MSRCEAQFIWGSAVALNACEEGSPFRAQTPAATGAPIALQKNARAGLSVLEIPARPMHVWHDISGGNSVALGEFCSQACGTIDGRSLPAATSKLTNLDANALAIAHAAVVGVITLFGRQQVLHGLSVIDAKVPNHPSGPTKSWVVATPLAFDDQITRVRLRGGVHALGRMNGYIARSHRSSDQSTMDIRRQECETDIAQSRTTVVGPRAATKDQASAAEHD